MVKKKKQQKTNKKNKKNPTLYKFLNDQECIKIKFSKQK